MVIKIFSIILITLIFLSTSVLASTHSANEILITIGEYTMTLQEAYDNTFLNDEGATPTNDLTTSLTKYHGGDEIQIYLKGNALVPGGNIIFLQNAISDKKSFCRENLGTLDFLNWNFIFGHGADVIIFEDGQTFKDKINTQQFCAYSWKGLENWNACSVNCGGGTQTQTITCYRSDGTDMGNNPNICTGQKPSDIRSCNTDECPPPPLECGGDGTEFSGKSCVDCPIFDPLTKKTYVVNPNIRYEYYCAGFKEGTSVACGYCTLNNVDCSLPDENINWKGCLSTQGLFFLGEGCSKCPYGYETENVWFAFKCIGSNIGCGYLLPGGSMYNRNWAGYFATPKDYCIEGTFSEGSGCNNCPYGYRRGGDSQFSYICKGKVTGHAQCGYDLAGGGIASQSWGGCFSDWLRYE